MKPTESIHFSKHELYVNEIELRSREEIYLFGFVHDRGEFHETQFIISRRDLQVLFNQNKQGIEILWKLENLTANTHSVPVTLNLVDMFGTTQIFEAKEIKLDVPFNEDEKGELVPFENQELLFVEEVIPFPGTRKNSF